ncbi:MAG: 4Fe-4S dicluster domain-containing protein [Syntrophorhabdaceae bacterium]|nr:4Fe-4S dicluster domain-containing protein [Syntrophorhabdaceae bacterium]
MQGKRIDREKLEGALKGFLKEPGQLIFGFGRKGGLVTHRMYRDDLHGFSMFNPYFSINGATLFRRVFSKDVKVLLMLRPCEIRSIVELIKLNQIEPEGITTLSIDCPGTVSLGAERDGLPDDPFEAKDYMVEHRDGMRWACTVCRERRGVVGDLGIRMAGDKSLWAFPYTEKGKAFLATIEVPEEEFKGGFLLGEDKKDAEPFATDMGTFSSELSRCILCKNCRDMCPICYCIDCLFNGDEYLPKGDALLNKIIRKGTDDLPEGRELFHMVRLYHVSQTCVGCGACEEACPQKIPLTKYFKGISERLQGMFSYMSGRDVKEIIPYLTFKEDELKDAED